MTSPMDTDDAFVFLREMLRSWGLLSLASDVKSMLVDGVPSEVVPLQLRETDEYKKRFKANLDRKNKGLNVLSEAEFLATETALKTVVRRFVGEGEFDGRDYTDKWISSDLAPQELADRLNRWSDAYDSQSQEFKDAWASHGLTRADSLRSVLNPNITEAQLKRRTGRLEISAEAFRAYGEDRLDDKRFFNYASADVTGDQAREAFQNVAGREERESLLASISGEEFDREDQEQAELFGGKEKQKRTRLLSRERGRFEENYVGGSQALRGEDRGSY